MSNQPGTTTPMHDDPESFMVRHLPIVATWCRRIGLADVVNSVVHSHMDIAPGTIAQAMVLDTLSGRSPLYHISRFFAHQDMELLLGSKSPQAEDLSDINVGRTLDAIHEAGPMKIYSQLIRRVASLYNLDLRHIHSDTTSVSVWGDYLLCNPDDEEQLQITYGHSKDHRPDLKQFVMSVVCAAKNIPVIGTVENGNSSDKTTNNKLLQRVASLMKNHGVAPGAYVYIADSAFVTEDNLNTAGDNLFISRLPATYKQCAAAIQDAVSRNQWLDVGTLNELPAASTRPPARYKICETSVTPYTKPYRAIVVHSSAHDARRLKRIDKLIAKDAKEIQDAIKPFISREYACMPDAETAVQHIKNLASTTHAITTAISSRDIFPRGRPSAKRKPSGQRFSITATLSQKSEALAQLRASAGCFVLISNTPTDGPLAHSPLDILRAYKDQDGVERNFSFLKDPLIVNDIFLKKPQRIEALGLILLISLLVWTLIEKTMRQNIKSDNLTITGWAHRKTKRPTTYMLTIFFSFLMIHKRGSTRYLVKPLNDEQTGMLLVLGLPADVFTNPYAR